MGYSTGVPQLDSFALAVTEGSVETTVITLSLVTISVIFCFFKLVNRTSHLDLPVLKVPGYSKTRSGKPTAPGSLSWPKLLKNASLKHNRPFIFDFPDMGRTVILPPKYNDDVKNNRDMSMDETSKKDFFPYYPGFDAMKSGLENSTFHDAVRVKLTQSLTFFTQDLSDEAKVALPDIFPVSNTWNSEVLYPAILDYVTRLSSLIFVGRDFEHMKEWQDITSSYTINLFNGARSLRQWRPWLRPIVHWFLPETTKLRAQVKIARSIIEPEVQRRRARRQEALKNGTQPRKSLDSVDWFEETSKGRSFDFVGGELLLSVVAIHTTTGTLTNAILDICANPDIIQPLREEIIAVLREDGGLERTSLHKLKLMDSVLKESQRLHPLGHASLRRQTLKDVTLHDGTVLPKGTFTMSGPLLNYDEATYPDPYKFDGYRFLKLRQRPGEDTKWQFVAVQSEHLGFGYGVHACPGRFFASNEIKIALMHMLMKYDWRLPDGGKDGRPESLELGMETPPDPTAALEFRSRASEIEL